MKEPQETGGNIHKAMISVMKDCKAIGKTQRNTQQSYDFRGIDDVYNALQQILAKNGVYTLPKIISEKSEERQSRSGATLIYRILHIQYNFYCEDGSSVSCDVIGEGMDSGDKASNKAMAVAHKYSLLQAFCIPTQEKKDPEHESPQVAPKMPTRASVNKKLLEMTTKEQVGDARQKFWEKYGSTVLQKPSNKQGDKSELWGHVFDTHFDRVTGVPPVPASTGPDEIVSQWWEASKTCRDRDSWLILEADMDRNKILQTDDVKNELDKINDELEKMGL